MGEGGEGDGGGDGEGSEEHCGVLFSDTILLLLFVRGKDNYSERSLVFFSEMGKKDVRRRRKTDVK